MTIQMNLNDRKELARRLIPFNHNEKLHYTGTPAFAYEGQGFRILRNGDIECDDEKTEAAITAFLQEAGILPQPEPEEGTGTEVTQDPPQQDETPESEALPQTETELDRMEIKIPVDGMNGAQLRNLVFMLHAQQYLLNRAAGHENIHVPDRLVEDLKEEPGTDQTSFFAIYQNYRKEGRGFWIAADTVTFCIAATGNAVKNRALIELAAFMVSAAKKAKRVQADTRKPEKREVLPADVAPAHRHGDQGQPRIAHGPAKRPEGMERLPHGRRSQGSCQKAEGTPASEPINFQFNS